MEGSSLMTQHFEIIVIGGGLAGAAAALSLSRRGHQVGWIKGKDRAEPDGRTTALLMPSIDLLEELGVWTELRDQAAPLRTMRLIDGSRRLLRAPTVSFHASEIDQAAFGYNVPNAALLASLTQAIEREERITAFPASATSVDPVADPARIALDDGSVLTTSLIVAADGRRSIARKAAGIGQRDWSYPQSALVLTFAHQFAHDEISTEFHTESGPFTQVPLPGRRSSLVWVERPAEAERILTLDRDAVGRAIEAKMQSMLGAVTVDSSIQRFPLSGMVASRFGQGAVVLVGEAGHAFPPIGAQGLNLGMRDIRTVGDLRLETATRRDVEDFAGRFDRARQLDVRSRTTGVDLLNRSLLTGFLPVQMARAGGLALLTVASPLRRAAMREGMRPGDALRHLWNSRKEVRR
jgi:2-octaprenyl-6-methoxyphenol hydroxylase